MIHGHCNAHHIRDQRYQKPAQANSGTASAMWTTLQRSSHHLCAIGRRLGYLVQHLNSFVPVLRGCWLTGNCPKATETYVFVLNIYMWFVRRQRKRVGNLNVFFYIIMVLSLFSRPIGYQYLQCLYKCSKTVVNISLLWNICLRILFYYFQQNERFYFCMQVQEWNTVGISGMCKPFKKE